MLGRVAGDPMGLSGQVLHGQFRVDELVEDGKRSVLYRGHHLMLEVPIAIKCMKPPPGAAPETFIRRFRHESRLHYKLAQGNPHIVRVLASGTAVAPANGGLCPFMVLEWLTGCSLAQDFRDRRAKTMHGRTLGEAIRLLDPAIDALAFAHACGIVHREVTPENLFLAETPEGQRVKVLDFGVAKILSDKALDLPPASQSMGLSPIGSPAYAAPEQFSAGIGSVGPWTDVYAIVMVLLEALLDRVVMEDAGPPMALRVMDPRCRPTPRSLGLDVGESVEAAIAQALAVQPEERPQDIGVFWGMLKNAAQKDVVLAAAPTHTPFAPSSDGPMTKTRPMAEVPSSAVPTAPAPTVALPHSPMATSVDRALDGSSHRLPRYADSADASPASSSAEDRTVVMHVEDIQKMNDVDLDVEPLTPGAELFVTDDQPTQMYREETLAAAGISPRTGWTTDEQLPTMVSAGAHKVVADTAPMTAKLASAPPPAPAPPYAGSVHAAQAAHAAQVAQAAQAAQAQPAHYLPPAQQQAYVLPAHGMPAGNAGVATIPPQGMRAQGAINYGASAKPKSGASLGLVLIAVFILVGLLAAAAVYAMGIL